MKNKLFALIFACLTFFAVPVLAEEKIESFDSLIQVQTDGSMIVTETIMVHHEGVQIRRGIYRDLATKKGEKYELIGVTRNGHYEPSFVERRSGYYRINTGNDDYLPQPGISTFEIKYKVWNLPKSFDSYDEVYWNVTGDEWAFPIENVSAKIELPYEADIIQQASYIGYAGSTEPATYEGYGRYRGRYLQPGEQLTIAVGFTPGVVSTKKHISKEDMFTEIVPFVLYFIYLGFLIWAWHKKGRDPVGRAIMPQYEPPEELTAAQAACLYKKGTAGNLASVSLIQMITNGFLKLKTKKEKILFFSQTTHTLEKTDKKPSNAEEECVSVNKLRLDGQYHRSIETFVRKIETKIKKSMKPYYTRNQVWVLLPTIVYLLIVGYIYIQKDPDNNILTLTGVGIFSFISCFLLTSVFQLLKGIIRNFSLANIIPLIILLFSLWGFIPPLYAGLHGSFSSIGGGHIIVLGTCITYLIFSYLLYQPTEKGQRLTEHLEGLKMFLKATKLPTRERLKIEEKLNEKNMEKLFPYAMALGLEKEWEKKFKELFGLTAYSTFMNHHPYTSHTFCSSFASNLSSCSTSRSSGHSGSGGGGCSGGGGGGGGGGGR